MQFYYLTNLSLVILHKKHTPNYTICTKKSQVISPYRPECPRVTNKKGRMSAASGRCPRPADKFGGMSASEQKYPRSPLATDGGGYSLALYSTKVHIFKNYLTIYRNSAILNLYEGRWHCNEIAGSNMQMWERRYFRIAKQATHKTNMRKMRTIH